MASLRPQDPDLGQPRDTLIFETGPAPRHRSLSRAGNSADPRTSWTVADETSSPLYRPRDGQRRAESPDESDYTFTVEKDTRSTQISQGLSPSTSKNSLRRRLAASRSYLNSSPKRESQRDNTKTKARNQPGARQASGTTLPCRPQSAHDFYQPTRYIHRTTFSADFNLFPPGHSLTANVSMLPDPRPLSTLTESSNSELLSQFPDITGGKILDSIDIGSPPSSRQVGGRRPGRMDPAEYSSAGARSGPRSSAGQAGDFYGPGSRGAGAEEPARRSSSRAQGGRGKGARWLSGLRSWVGTSEPSTQALKKHQKMTFRRAGIEPGDPRAKAKLHAPIGAIPDDAIRPAGRGPEPEELVRRRAEERRKAREL